MATANICNYSPIINLSIRDLNGRFKVIHRYLCYLASAAGGGGLTSVSTTNSASVTWTGNGTSGNPLVATATATATPAGATTQVQYNNAGAFGASANFTFTSGTNTLGITNVQATAVGIGIAPLFPLHIEGATAGASSAQLVNTDALGTASGGRLSLSVKLLPTANTNQLGALVFTSRNGINDNLVGAEIAAQALGAWTATTNQPTTLIFRTTNTSTLTEKMRITGSGNVGVGQSNPLAVIHIKAGTATAATAPIKLTAGTNMTTPEAGAVEFDGTNYFVTSSTTRFTLAKTLTNTAALDFPNTSGGASADLTIALTGAVLGDIVVLGVPNASVNANTCYTAWVSAADTVTVRFNNYNSVTAVDPASGTFRVAVLRY